MAKVKKAAERVKHTLPTGTKVTGSKDLVEKLKAQAPKAASSN